MITKFAVENFKGIGERVEVQLKPLTLLFGPNSVGKSSILHALHYAREVFRGGDLDADRTLAGGDLIRLGGFRNFVHGRDLNREVRLSVELKMWDDFRHPSYWHSKEDPFDATPAVLSELEFAESEVSVAWSELLGKPYIRRRTTRLDGEWITSIEYSPDRLECLLTVNTAHKCLSSTHPDRYLAGDSSRESAWILPVEDLKLLAPELSAVSSLEATASALQLALAVAKDLGLLAISLEGDMASVALRARKPGDPWPEFPFALDQRMSKGTRAAAWNVAEQSVEFNAGERIQTELLPSARTDTIQRVAEFCRMLDVTLREIAVPPYELAVEDLDCVTSLGPLRATPGRQYAPTAYTDESPWASGLGAWAELFRHGEVFLADVNSWLADPERLDTGYRLKKKYVDKSGEAGESPAEPDLSQPAVTAQPAGSIFAQLGIVLDPNVTARHDRGDPTVSPVVLIPVNSELELQPHDVGTGISQLIPVVVLALRDSDELVATVEQPELHLHPRLQAALGDLLIEGARRKTAFLIETHSEHLLLRLLRRIRESSEGTLPEGCQSLKPDQLAVLYVETDSGNVRVTRLHVTEDGDFTGNWPGGFFDERAKELF